MEKLNVKVITGKAKLSYAHIWEPKAMNDSVDMKYSCSLIIPKSDVKTIAAIKDAIENAKKNGAAKWGGKVPSVLKLPLRDGDEEKPDDENYKNSYFLNASAKAKPGIVDRNCKPIMDMAEVYSGCYVAAAINFYPFNTNGNKGIAVGLDNIMKIADGTPLGGRASAESDFAGIDLPFEDEPDFMG